MSQVERKLLLNAFDSNWIAPVGPDIEIFEKISKYLKNVHSCALSSGTAALHLALRILGIKSGDTVLCPSLTFAATANAIMYQNATPIFIDVNQKHWVCGPNIIEEAIKKYQPKSLLLIYMVKVMIMM